MDARQTALKLVLDEIGEDSAITSVDERLRVQKAIYLAQALGLNLGYSYSWYVKGPYSTGLTRDYYALAESLSAGENEAEGKTLNPSVRALTPPIRELLQKPPEVALAKPQWYELLASLHFLLTASRYEYKNACETIRQAKPHLAAFIALGYEHLRQHRLVA